MYIYLLTKYIVNNNKVIYTYFLSVIISSISERFDYLQ